MKRLNAIGLAAALGLFAPGARAQGVQKLISGWPDANKKAAQALIEKYGQPDETDPGTLEWHNRGSFKHIVVSGAPRPLGMVSHVVSYRVPVDVGLLRLENCYVVPDKAADELTSVGDSEALNTLCLNVANEIIRGRDVKEARAFQSRTLSLRAAGKSSDYFDKLLFAVP
jgi:hypothetical protein